jgi:hypothetical protein
MSSRAGLEVMARNKVPFLSLPLAKQLQCLSYTGSTPKIVMSGLTSVGRLLKYFLGFGVRISGEG